MSRAHQTRILNALLGFIEDFPDHTNRFDCVNFCVGYFGNVGPDHIEVINYLYRMDVIEA